MNRKPPPKKAAPKKAAPWLPDLPPAPPPASARGAAPKPKGTARAPQLGKRGDDAPGSARAPQVGKRGPRDERPQQSGTRRRDRGQTSETQRFDPSVDPRWRAATPPASPRAAEGPGRAGTPGRIDDPYAEREARRYEFPIPSREAILGYLSQRGELMTAERIADALACTEPAKFDPLVKRLSAMVRDGQLLVNRRGGYGVAQKLDLIAGTIIANADGYGFLRPDNVRGDDIYLSPAQMRSVLHGDRVLVNVVGLDRRGRREGAIAQVLERRAPRLVGRYQEQDGFGLVVPDDSRIHQDVLIPAGKHCGARSGQIVVAEMTEPPTRERPPIGRVVAVLGEKLTASLTVRMAIESHGLPHEWSAAVTSEAAAVSPQVLDAEIAGREDLRSTPLVTIDGEDARDFDDAVFCEKYRSGFRLVVAIADVSHYVRPKSALDDEAYERSTSVYFPGFVVPMLPETLSNGICSLNPKVDRMCMVCDMLVDHKGDVQKSRFYPAVMRSAARLTYTQVWKALGENDEAARAQIGASLMPHLQNLYALYKVLAHQRRQRGAIEFESNEVKFRLAPTGEVLQMGAYERNDAHKLIEECMIAANVQAARFLERSKVPAPYRVHAPPPADKYENLLEFLKEFKLKLPPHEQVQPKDFAKLMEEVKQRPESALLQSVLLRSQSLAVYHASNDGHFGLALDAYAHFTSPIRRYPDLLVHRAIRHAISGAKPGEYLYSDADMERMAAHCSQRERRADEAERDVDERFKCAWMEKHVGSQFKGVVTGVTSFGLFVELDESKVSGLVHITQLPNDYYHFDPARHLLSGERRGLKFRLGDPVEVLVLRASLEDRKIDFRLVQKGDEGKLEAAFEAGARGRGPGAREKRGRRR